MKTRIGQNKNGQIESRQRLAIFFIALTSIVLIWIFREHFLSLSRLGLIGIFFINFFASATVLFPFPGVASVFLGGAVINPFAVGIISGVGAGSGELLGYFVGYGGRGLIHKTVKRDHWVRKLQFFFHSAGFVTILVLSALPIPIFDFVGIFAGTIGYPVGKYYIATVMGRSIRNIIIAWTGAKVLPL